jgi:ADP-ribosylglycohydrolase
MLMAAMLAWAFVTDDIQEIVRVGLSEIPRNCRLAEAVHAVVDAYHDEDQGQNWELAYEQLLLRYGAYSPIHTLNNTAWVILALLYSGGDFGRALGLAVACGMDTGSNAASVGSLMGLIHSRALIPDQWIAPLDDALCTALAQFPTARISDLARRTAAIAEKTLSTNPDHERKQE